jgi:predicted nucleic acid-binding protein
MAVFVPDASATLAWCFEDETSDWTESLLARLKSGDTAVVPQHWPVEVANTFLVAVRGLVRTKPLDSSEICSRFPSVSMPRRTKPHLAKSSRLPRGMD